MKQFKIEAHIPGLTKNDELFLVTISDGIIQSIDELGCKKSSFWLLPGFVDLQLNDFEWLSKGLQSPEAHCERLLKVYEHQKQLGVTSCAIATLAAPTEELLSYLKGLNLAMQKQSGILGAVVEGTFMNPQCLGAHNAKYVFPPSRNNLPLLKEIISTGSVRSINIAPEIDSESHLLIQNCKEQNILVCTGHAKPTARQLETAVKEGIEYIIHFGNGNTTSSTKIFEGGGFVEECLRNDHLTLTVICDLIHVMPAALLDWIERKTIYKMVCISDAAFALGAPSTKFEVFGIPGTISEDKKYLMTLTNLSRGIPTLFGSCLFMDSGFLNLVNIFTSDHQGIYYRLHKKCSFQEAIYKATLMCCTNPANLFKKNDRGEIKVGKRADLVLVEMTGQDSSYSMNIKQVWTQGE